MKNKQQKQQLAASTRGSSIKTGDSSIETEDSRIAIVGAGLSGSLLALRLAQKGYGVDVYERRPDPREIKKGGGRSINLGLSKRGMEALKLVGLLDEVLGGAVCMRGRVIHVSDGTTRYQAYGKNEYEVLHSIDRNELNHLLLDRAEQYPKLKLHFEHRLIRVNKEKRELELEAGEVIVKAHPKWVVGADGAFSNMRKELQRGERANFHQEFLEWGYKELTLPAGPNGESAIELSAFHVWPRSHSLVVSHPNRDGSHTLTLFLPFTGRDSFESLKTVDEVKTLFTKYFPDLTPLLPGLLEEWESHPVGTLITTRTSQWSFGDWAVLVGDACHAQYPFYGQGMNSAFEDCCLLISSLENHKEDLATAFQSYELIRRPHTDVLGELSKSNFVELRQKVRSPWFVARKKLDLAIHRIFPNTWLPLYSMITHSTIPYGDALIRSQRQDKILNMAVGCVLAGVSTGIFYLWGGVI